MGSETEPAKTLLPYLQRADELQNHDPLVAYYCRLYAMEKGMRIPNSERTKTTNALLRSLINQLEKDKKSLSLGPEDNLHLEGFALNVFSKADKQDRAGRGDLSTAKTFYAASIFFEILNQFGTLQPDLEQKQKYAVWKAADIRKAIKEGRKPNPGPPGGDDDLSVPSSSPAGAYDMGPSETSLGPESGQSSIYRDDISDHHSTDIPRTSHLQDKTNDQYPSNIPPSAQLRNNFVDQHSTSFPPSPHYQDKVNDEHGTSFPPPSYSPATYSAHDIRPPPPPSRSESSVYSQQYAHQTYPQEPHHHLPQNYPSNETASPYSFPNFQSYPSFSESSLPSVPAQHSYYQGSDNSFSSHSAPPGTNISYSSHAAPPTNYSSVGQNSSGSRNGSVSEPAITPAQTYQYDSNYQPPPENIAKAHKAARFAVSALAFDDVSTAIEHLKNSLELLTDPSAV